jgi:hypothetical protein
MGRPEHLLLHTSEEEGFVSNPGAEPNSPDRSGQASVSRTGVIGRIGVDWWATIVAGLIVVLAAGGLLPTIPW